MVYGRVDFRCVAGLAVRVGIVVLTLLGCTGDEGSYDLGESQGKYTKTRAVYKCVWR